MTECFAIKGYFRSYVNSHGSCPRDLLPLVGTQDGKYSKQVQYMCEVAHTFAGSRCVLRR